MPERLTENGQGAKPCMVSNIKLIIMNRNEIFTLLESNGFVFEQVSECVWDVKAPIVKSRKKLEEHGLAFIEPCDFYDPKDDRDGDLPKWTLSTNYDGFKLMGNDGTLNAYERTIKDCIDIYNDGIQYHEEIDN